MHFGSDVFKCRPRHSKDEWAQIEAERRKAEDEAFAERKTQGEVVPAGARPVVRDSFGIHPDETEVIRTRIREIVRRHVEIESMPRRMLVLAWEEGQELIELKENKVYSGKWKEFCEDVFPEISLRNIERYIQLAKNKEWLLAKYEKTTRRVDFDELPPIRQALTDIQQRNREERERQGKPPIGHRSATKEKQGSQSVRDVQVETAVSSHPEETSQPAAKLGEPDNPDGEESDKGVEKIPEIESLRSEVKTEVGVVDPVESEMSEKWVNLRVSLSAGRPLAVYRL